MSPRERRVHCCTDGNCDDCKAAESRYRKELAARKREQNPNPLQTRRIQEQPIGWQKRANCQDRDDLDWIGSAGEVILGGPAQKRKAKGLAREFCADCPVRVECLEYGIKTKSMGVWGGSYLAWEPRKKVVNLL